MTEAAEPAQSEKERRAAIKQAARNNLAKGRAVLAEKAADRKRKKQEALQRRDADPEDEEPKGAPGESAPGAPPLLTADDVARKHAEPSPPSMPEVAQSTPTYGGGADAVPPPETDSSLSGGMTSEEAPDFAGDAAPTSFDGIFNCSHFDFDGTGQYYVSVDRKTPRQSGGISCGGMQRIITRNITRDEFAGEYGGGNYLLVVFGPPPRGRIIDRDTGRPARKALTKPIKVELSIDHYPVNLQSGVLDGDDSEEFEEEETMQQHPGPRANGGRRPQTSADARIHEANLGHDERLRDREDRIRREAASRGEQLQGQLPAMMGMVTEQMNIQANTAREEAGRREEQHREDLREREARERRLEEKIEAASEKPSETSALGDALASVMNAMKSGGGDDSKAAVAALEQARNELTRITEKHAGDVQRLTKDNADAVQRAREEHDRMRERDERLARDELTRAEERVGQERTRADRRIEDVDKRSEKLLKDTKEDATRLVTDTRTSMQQRIDDQRGQHDRDMKQNDKGWESRIASQKDMYENRLSTLVSEITRERSETSRYRDEAEKNKDILSKVTEIRDVATALGMSDDNPPPEELPKDWKGLLMLVARDVVQKLPDTIASAGDTVRSLRQPVHPSQAEAMQQAEYAAMHGQPRQLAGAVPPPLRARDGTAWQPNQEPMEFGTEDGPSYGMGQTGVDGAMAPPPPQAAPLPAQPVPQPVVAAPVPAPPPPAAVVPAPEQQPAVAPQPNPQQPVVAQAQPAQSAPDIDDEQIVAFAPALLQAYEEEGVEPEDFAQGFIAEVGPAAARGIAMGLHPSRVAGVLMRQPGGASHPLVRREGQRYLGEIVRLIIQMTQGG